MTWHESWRTMKGRANALAELQREVSRKITSDIARDARKQTGVRGKLVRGRWEYDDVEFQKMVNHLKERFKKEVDVI